MAKFLIEYWNLNLLQEYVYVCLYSLCPYSTTETYALFFLIFYSAVSKELHACSSSVYSPKPNKLVQEEHINKIQKKQNKLSEV